MSDNELPRDSCKNGILIIEIPGLCYGGTVDVRNNSKGYVVFTRRDADKESVSSRNFRHYHSEVYSDFVSNLRKKYFNIEETDPIAKSHTSVGWLDGAIDQLSAVNSENIKSGASEQRNLKCKQSAKRTETEQAMDCMDTFKILHAAEKFTGTYSVLDVSLQQTVESIFNKLQSQKILIFPLKKKSLSPFFGYTSNKVSEGGNSSSYTERFHQKRNDR